MDLFEVLVRMPPLEQRVVAMVYFEGRTSADVAQRLTVDRGAVTAALARAFRDVARWVLDDDDGLTVSSTPSVVGLSYDAVTRHAQPARLSVTLEGAERSAS